MHARASLVLLLMTLALLVADVAFAQRPGQPLYKYKDNRGRIVYVDSPDLIPLQYRPKSQAVDLAGIPLNEEVGNATRDRTNQAYKALEERRAKEAAEELRRMQAADGMERFMRPPGFEGIRPCTDGAAQSPEDTRPIWQIAWADYRPFVVAGALIVLLFLVTPAARRNMPPEKWSRVLMFAVPTLLFVATMGHVAGRAGRFARLARSGTTPCIDAATMKAVAPGYEAPSSGPAAKPPARKP